MEAEFFCPPPGFMSTLLYAQTVPQRRSAAPHRREGTPPALDAALFTRESIRRLPDTAELDTLTDDELRTRIDQMLEAARQQRAHMGDPAAVTRAASSKDTGSEDAASGDPTSEEGDDAEDEEPAAKNRLVAGVLALLPGEVILLHSAILSVAVKTEGIPDEGSNGLQVLANPSVLTFAFFFLLVGSSLLYVAGRFRSGNWDHRWDYLRMCIPPVAFVAWSLLEPATALDHVLASSHALASSLDTDWQGVLGLCLAVTVVSVASLVAYRVAPAQEETKAD